MSGESSPAFCRYNCPGLRFGKVDVGRYGEVSERSVIFSALPLFNDAAVVLMPQYHLLMLSTNLTDSLSTVIDYPMNCF